ncbi:hypothetical protein LCGC14_1069060 [marine sediment metagenome]|uniref:Uncharacterized protein n=1 Tax=marine sediment metagenome TaxID=412755 RepID=A0A0F9QPK7_9ZZZZ
MCDFNSVETGKAISKLWKDISLKGYAEPSFRHFLESTDDSELDRLAYSASCILWRLLNKKGEQKS